MKVAYKEAEGMKLGKGRLLIDVERGRTVKGWKPRRLGGGLGGRPKLIKEARTFLPLSLSLSLSFSLSFNINSSVIQY
jgi:hypothetical protein